MREEILRLLVVLISSTVATTGIIMMFGIEKRVLLWAVISSVLCCGGYELVLMAGGSLFVACMVGSAASAVYSEIMAHPLRVPATVMIIPGIVPLVPGGRLYYTMLGAVNSDMLAFSENGKSVLLMAAGIAIGIIAVTAVSKPVNARIRRAKEKKEGRCA